MDMRTNTENGGYPSLQDLLMCLSPRPLWIDRDRDRDRDDEEDEEEAEEEMRARDMADVEVAAARLRRADWDELLDESGIGDEDRFDEALTRLIEKGTVAARRDADDGHVYYLFLGWR